MKLVVKGRNTDVSEETRDYIEKKVGKLDHYLENITEAQVEVAEERTRSQGGRFVIQVTAFANGTILRAQERDANFRTAVDAVAHTIVQQTKRFKEKLQGRGKSGPTIRSAEPVSPAVREEGFEEAEPGVIAKIKRFPIKPMDPDEAVEQMELLGHDFFLFLNAASGQYGVVYRRANGQYGLIEPE